ncbi:uncharacterized protein LOC132706394 isoform X3 [Cylas formicarius]|uniref:uncharacterized protein LOC132706394 isoform X3 n=1 Tax=Cylas formicarius TaxID=197179 RepID=UPI002958575A|nr:uncharacterized protein LOC132706394 isoform X3 [Cylas formicarius]
MCKFLQGREILKLSRYSMLLAGIWRLPWTKSSSLNKVYRFYSAAIQIYFPLFLTSMTVNCAQMLRNNDHSGTVFRSFAMMITLFIVEVKAILFQTASVKRIIAQVMDEEKSILDYDDREITRNHSNRVRFCRKSNFAIFGFNFFSGVAMIAGNIIARFQIDRRNEMLNATTAKPFIYDLYYATLDPEEHPTFLIFVNYVSLSVAGFMISTQVVFVSCIVFAASMLETLQVKFKKPAGFKDDASLRRLISEHQHAIRFVEMLNDSTKHLMLLEYLLNSLNVASVSIQFLVSERNASLAFPIFHFGLLLVQIFVLAWSSNEIKVQSSGLADAIYECLWFERTEYSKKLLLIAIIRSQRPLVLTIGPLGAMTNESALTDQQILKLPRNTMLLAGIWRFPWTSNVLLAKVYQFYSALIQIYYPVFLTSMSVGFAKMLGEQVYSVSVFRSFGMMITLFVVQVKVILFQTRGVKRIISQVMEEERPILDSDDGQIIRNHSKRVRFCRISSMAIFGFNFLSGVAMTSANIIARFQIGRRNEMLNETTAKPFIYDLYYPALDPQEHPTFPMVVNYISMPVAAFMVSTQVVFVSCVVFAASMLETLQVKFKKSAGFEDDATLRRLISEHQHAIRFVEKLNDSTKHLMLLEYLLNSLNVASVSIQFLVSERNVSLAFPIFHFGLLLVQIFVLAWSSNEIKVQSLELADAIYECPWFERSEYSKKLLLVAIMRSQRPLVLTIGPLGAMSNESALTDTEISVLPRNAMLLAGIWRLPWTSSVLLAKIYQFYSAAIQIYYPVFLTSMSVSFAKMLGEQIYSISVFRLFGVLITMFVVEIKVVLFQIGSVRQVIAQVIQEEKLIFDSGDARIIRKYSKRVQFCRIYSMAIFSFIFFSSVAMIWTNIMARQRTERHNLMFNESTVKPFMYDLYFPSLDTDKYPTFPMVVNYLSIPVAGFMISTQVVFVSCVVFAASMLETLQVKFKKSAAFEDDATLKILISEHQHAIRFVKNLNNSTKYLILLEFLLNSVNVAFVSVQFLVTKPGAPLAIPAIHFAFLLVQVFCLAWSANEIKTQSLELADAFYEGLWFERSNTIKKLVLIMITRAQRPLVLTIGPFGFMTNESALTIMKAAYSYVTLMANTYR